MARTRLSGSENWIFSVPAVGFFTNMCKSLIARPSWIPFSEHLSLMAHGSEILEVTCKKSNVLASLNLFVLMWPSMELFYLSNLLAPFSSYSGGWSSGQYMQWSRALRYHSSMVWMVSPLSFLSCVYHCRATRLIPSLIRPSVQDGSSRDHPCPFNPIPYFHRHRDNGGALTNIIHHC